MAYDEEVPTGMAVKGISELVEEALEDADFISEQERKERDTFHSTLEGYVVRTYEENKQARTESSVDQEMLDSLYQVNGEYTPAEIASMLNKSNIFMNLTATKKRAGMSWIQDILQPANAFPMEFRPTPVEELPPEIEESIRDSFERDQQELVAKIREKYQAHGQPPEGQVGPDGQPVQQAPPKPPSAMSVSRELREINELKRDIDEAITEEINKVARQQCVKIQTKVLDDLKQGGWDPAFSEFISDFLVFPTAFMKGPVVTTKKKLTYKNGIPEVIREVVFLNKRVSPFDIYPSPSAESVYDGNFVEHLRLTRKELSDLAHIGNKSGYYKDNIVEVLEAGPECSLIAIDNQIEESKAGAEKRGNQTYASKGIYHGLHFWGTASVKMLREWGLREDDEIAAMEDWEEIEVEVILVGNKVVKCLINKDPLGRRPYYAASYTRRPGSLWGKSMPASMRDIQRMCNGAARALADNMGLSSGPQCAILVDRLADDGPIEEQRPHKIWQFSSDPQGNGGRPIEWFTIPSNANELLAVYDRFEMKADDVTGIPRYSYGNEQVGGAAQTMGGLSILMESASKGIKSAIKNISEGVLIPRAEYQFYLRLLKAQEDDEPLDYHGDINVVVFAAEAITLKAAEQEAQRELLQTTANPVDLEIMGKVGRADMLRTVLKTANFREDIIPSRLTVKLKDEEQQAQLEQQQAQMAQTEQQKMQTSVQATQIQIDGQKEMHDKTMQATLQRDQLNAQLKARDQKLRAVEIDQRDRIATQKALSQKDIAKMNSDTTLTTATQKAAVDAQKANTVGYSE